MELSKRTCTVVQPIDNGQMIVDRSQSNVPSDAPDGNKFPVLILLASGSNHSDGGLETRLLGLTLRDRAARAARRAGYARIMTIGEEDTKFDLPETVGRLVFAPANALAELSWLEAAADVALPAGGWGFVSGRVVIVDTAITKKAIEDPAQFRDLDALQEHLAGHLESGDALPNQAAPMLVAGPECLVEARRRLLSALVKETDGFMARHFHRPISIAISQRLADTPITPNQMSLVSASFGLMGAPFFLSSSPDLQTIGALLFLWHSILDGCDGELARLKFQESHWGGVLDFWGDNVVHITIFACMGVGWALAVDASWPLVLGATAVLGTLSSAGFVYFRMMRKSDKHGPLYTSVGKDRSRRLTQLLDQASRRDFIYLVVALSLFGKASWFLVLTGIGAPVYFVLLLIVATREAGRR